MIQFFPMGAALAAASRREGGSRPVPMYRVTTFLRGLLAVLFGVPLIVWTGVDTNRLVVAFGIYSLLAAALALGAALQNQSRPLGMLALANLAAGLFFLAAPRIELLRAVYVIGAWAMMTGILELFASAAALGGRSNRWHQAAAGATMTILGALLGVFPELDVASLGGLLGASSMLFGLLLMAPPGTETRVRPRIRANRPA